MTTAHIHTWEFSHNPHTSSGKGPGLVRDPIALNTGTEILKDRNRPVEFTVRTGPIQRCADAIASDQYYSVPDFLQDMSYQYPLVQ